MSDQYISDQGLFTNWEEPQTVCANNKILFNCYLNCDGIESAAADSLKRVGQCMAYNVYVAQLIREFANDKDKCNDINALVDVDIPAILVEANRISVIVTKFKSTWIDALIKNKWSGLKDCEYPTTTVFCRDVIDLKVPNAQLIGKSVGFDCCDKNELYFCSYLINKFVVQAKQEGKFDAFLAASPDILELMESTQTRRRLGV